MQHISSNAFNAADDALTQWEAWNSMVTTHLQKQHNPTLHAMHEGGLSGDEALPHWLTPTRSSAVKVQRNPSSTARSRAELYKAAVSPSRGESAVSSVATGRVSASSSPGRRLSRASNVGPSAAESSPSHLGLLVSVPPLSMMYQDVFVGHRSPDDESAPQTKRTPREADSDFVSGAVSSSTGTPRSGRAVDRQRLQRLKQQRSMLKARDDTPSTKLLTLDDLAQGALLEQPVIAVTSAAPSGAAKGSAQSTTVQTPPLTPSGDDAEEQLAPCVVTVSALSDGDDGAHETRAVPVATPPQAALRVEAFPASTDVLRNQHLPADLVDACEGILSSPDSSSDDVDPASSEGLDSVEKAQGAPSQLVAVPTPSKKKAAVEQLTYRKKKELKEKIRSRQQQQAYVPHDANDGSSAAEKVHNACGASAFTDAPTSGLISCLPTAPLAARPHDARREVIVRKKDYSQDSQQSNADAEVSRDDENTASAKRTREKKGSRDKKKQNVAIAPALHKVMTSDECHAQPSEHAKTCMAITTVANDDTLPGAGADVEPVPPPHATTHLRNDADDEDSGDSADHLEAACSDTSGASVRVADPPSAQQCLPASAADSDDELERAVEALRREKALQVAIDIAEAQPPSESTTDDPDLVNDVAHQLCAIEGVEEEIEEEEEEEEVAEVDEEVESEAAEDKEAEKDENGKEASSDHCLASGEMAPRAAVKNASAGSDEPHEDVVPVKDLTAALLERDDLHDAVARLQRQLECVAAERDEVLSRVHRLELRQSNLLIALHRSNIHLEVTEEENEARLQLVIEEQREADAIAHDKQENETCLEALRHDELVTANVERVEADWMSRSAQWDDEREQLQAIIREAREALVAAEYYHEEDVAEREAAFDAERVEMATGHLASREMMAQHCTEHVSKLCETLITAHEESSRSLLEDLETSAREGLIQLQALKVQHYLSLEQQRGEARRRLRDVQTTCVDALAALHVAVLARENWAIQGDAFNSWRRYLEHRTHAASLASLRQKHENALVLLRNSREELHLIVAEATARQSLEAVHLEEATGCLVQAFAESCNVIRQKEASIGQLEMRCASLTESLAESRSTEMPLRARVAKLERLALKSEDVIGRLQHELYNLHATQAHTAMKLEHAKGVGRRLSLQRDQLVARTSRLQRWKLLNETFSRWCASVLVPSFGKSVHLQRMNDDARAELRRWREHVLAASSPLRKPTAAAVCPRPSAASQHASRTGSMVGTTPDDSRNASLCDVLVNSEDDIAVALKYLLSRERSELAQVKLSLQKHRDMLMEGNEAMDTMLLEMEILSRQNKELVVFCQRKGLDVPKSLTATEVSRLSVAVRDNQNGTSSPDTAQVEARMSPASPPPALSYAKGDEGSDGYVVD